MLAAPPMTAEEIAQRLRTVMITYFVPPMAEPERRAWVANFVAALSDVPRAFAVEAWEWWNREGKQRPKPSELREYARERINQARERVKIDAPRRRDQPVYGPPASADERARREEISRRLAETYEMIRPSLVLPCDREGEG